MSAADYVTWNLFDEDEVVKLARVAKDEGEFQTALRRRAQRLAAEEQGVYPRGVVAINPS